jgi:GNAT superfamily N-acetyltransferase
MLKIRAIEPAEIPLLKDFAPPDWKSDLSALFTFHFGQPYFHPIVAEVDGAIVGCAEGLLNGKVGWLGNIVVLPEYRGRGIGHALTAQLVDYFSRNGCSAQVLIATQMGEPVYRRLGFEVRSRYIFLGREQTSPPADLPAVQRLAPADHLPLLALDRRITGEDRQAFLGRFLADAWVYRPSPDAAIEGFYLPGLGNGPVLADNDEAGLSLLHFKLGQGCQIVVVPVSNSAALGLLLETGFVETTRAPRMVLGKEVGWQPARVYGRGAGYCG